MFRPHKPDFCSSVLRGWGSPTKSCCLHVAVNRYNSARSSCGEGFFFFPLPASYILRETLFQLSETLHLLWIGVSLSLRMLHPCSLWWLSARLNSVVVGTSAIGTDLLMIFFCFCMAMPHVFLTTRIPVGTAVRFTHESAKIFAGRDYVAGLRIVNDAGLEVSGTVDVLFPLVSGRRSVHSAHTPSEL
jgi:hypothetical protein